MRVGPQASRALGRVSRKTLGVLALFASAQACNSNFVFDASRATAGAAGMAVVLPQAGTPAAAGVTSAAGSSGAATGGGGGSGGVQSAGGSSGGAGGSMPLGAAAGADAGTAGVPPVTANCAVACPTPLHCAGGTCAQCAVDDDCVPYHLARCDPSRHRCVACLETTDCQTGFTCDELANRCLQTCAADLDCPASAHGCDELRRVCYQCDEDEECLKSPLGHLCASDGSGCVQCRKNADCSGQMCDQLTGRCVDCRDADGCASALCNPMTGTCINP